jgi:hypothetical protein
MAQQSAAKAIGQSYNSFSGIDIKAVFNNVVIGELQAISYSITREKAPIYTMGSADPRAFGRGKRGIAGSMIFIVFDRGSLIGTFGAFARNPGDALNFSADKEELRSVQAGNTANIAGGIAESRRLLEAARDESPILNVGGDQAITAPWYIDQIPPFDVTLAAANEYGALAVMRIFQVECLNEGYGVSIDDIVSEQQVTYVARQVINWQPISNPNIDLIGGPVTADPSEP